jgi:hypothetical protein
VDLARVIAALARQQYVVRGQRLEVEKNAGSTRSKSRSARMRSISTEPTMPRQPIIPTRVIELPVEKVIPLFYQVLES